MMPWIRELGDFFRFFWKTSPQDKVVVFYAEHEGYYPNLEGLIEELRRRGQSLCYVTSDPKDPVLERQQPGVKTFYIQKLLTFFMLFVNCKAFVMTLTDLHRFHLKRSVYPVHYVYVFHSMVSTHMAYLEGAFDHYDSILCVGPHQIAEIRKREAMLGLPAKALVPAGYYRLERVHARYQSYRRGEAGGQAGKITVLVAPSWGEKNVLESCGQELVRTLLDASFRVIVRPHPETVRRRPELLKSLQQEFGQNPDFRMERSVRSDESLLQADLLVCDCSGIALEYALGTERPVLFLDLPCKIRNKDYEALGLEPWELTLRKRIGKLVPPHDLAPLPELLRQMHAQRDFYREQIQQCRQEGVYAFGQSSSIGAKHITDLCKT